MTTTNQSRIFISYSHRGKGPEWKARLLRALEVFERHHLLDVWEDGKIRVSAAWNDDITQAMSSANLAVFLLTPEALESEFIRDRELPFLRGRWQQERIPVFPVVCEPCPWKEQEQSRWLCAIQSPAGAEPLSCLSDAVADRHLRDLATAIAEELGRLALAAMSSSSPLGGARAGVRGTSDARTYLDRFPVTRGLGLREEKLIGREQELALLDLAFAQPHTSIVSLVAWGGVGKTMLVRHWLQRLQREGWFGARRIYAWSFHSQGTKEDRQASEDAFLTHALAWLGVPCEPTLPPWEKGRILADAVARERTVLVLDGVEPLQFPPGPMGGQLRAPGVQSLLKHLAREASAIDSRLPTPSGALCLVTTREPLADLADFQRREGAAWGSVLRVDLGNLTDEAGAALLHHAGANRAGAAEVKREDGELLAASREVDGHPLTLHLLGRYLARAHGGDIRRRDLVRFEEADRHEQGGTTFKMLAAFERWFGRSGDFGARQLAVLRILGLFDRPADAGCLDALREPPVIPGLTDPLFTARMNVSPGQDAVQPLAEEEWNMAISFLADFSLVAVQTGDGNAKSLLDCHPLIREHFASQLRATKSEAWRAAHLRLCEHLEGSRQAHPGSGEDQPGTLEGLEPLYHALAHGSQAGLFDRALNLFWIRIRREAQAFSIKKLGCIGHDLAGLSCFFSSPFTCLRLEMAQSDQKGWILNEAAYCLRAMGRLPDALGPFRLSLEDAEARHEWKNGTYAAVNVSDAELLTGDIAAAIRSGEHALSLAARAEGWKSAVAAHVSLANALAQAGQGAEARGHFEAAEALQKKFQEENPWGFTREHPYLYAASGFRYCEVLMGETERAAWLRLLGEAHPSALDTDSRFTALGDSLAVETRARQSMTVAAEHSWLHALGLDHLTLARVAIYDGLLGCVPAAFRRAREDVDDAEANIRKSGETYSLPSCLLARAWVRVLLGEAGAARADLNEAWDIAERSSMRLQLADIHLHRARLFCREKPYPWISPQADLAAAGTLIADYGYHRRDAEIADAKRAILGGERGHHETSPPSAGRPAAQGHAWDAWGTFEGHGLYWKVTCDRCGYVDQGDLHDHPETSCPACGLGREDDPDPQGGKSSG